MDYNLPKNVLERKFPKVVQTEHYLNAADDLTFKLHFSTSKQE